MIRNSIKLLLLDLDGTLISTKSGATFPINMNDWKVKERVIAKANEFVSEGYRPVLVTNQGGIGLGYITLEDFKKKVSNIEIETGIKFDRMFIADKMKSPYRKPKIELIRKELNQFYSNLNINFRESIFIGDAGGRSTDHSSDDIDFATNLGVKFIHAEDI